MPCLIRLLTPDGLKPVDYRAESLADAARYEPHDGVYTITNTYNTFQVLKLDGHLDRLENSAGLAGIPLALDRGAAGGTAPDDRGVRIRRRALPRHRPESAAGLPDPVD
jgi:hypothetical protein